MQEHRALKDYSTNDGFKKIRRNASSFTQFAMESKIVSLEVMKVLNFVPVHSVKKRLVVAGNVPMKLNVFISFRYLHNLYKI